jgi:hypothetical protein
MPAAPLVGAHQEPFTGCIATNIEPQRIRKGMAPAPSQTIPFLPYRLFFFYIEPISSIAGAYHAAFRQQEYLELLTLTSAPHPSSMITTQMSTSLAQLANLYFFLCTTELLVLTSTTSLRVWRRLLLCLLIADVGHLLTMSPLGLGVFWKVWEWNSMMWGSVGFVYLLAVLRLCFLMGLGLRAIE